MLHLWRELDAETCDILGFLAQVRRMQVVSRILHPSNRATMHSLHPPLALWARTTDRPRAVCCPVSSEHVMLQLPTCVETAMAKRSAQPLKQTRAACGRACRQDQQPADPVVVQLFADLQLAKWARANSKSKHEAKAFERQAWSYLIRYLATLERPDVRSYD